MQKRPTKHETRGTVLGAVQFKAIVSAASVGYRSAVSLGPLTAELDAQDGTDIRARRLYPIKGCGTPQRTEWGVCTSPPCRTCSWCPLVGSGPRRHVLGSVLWAGRWATMGARPHCRVADRRPSCHPRASSGDPSLESEDPHGVGQIQDPRSPAHVRACRHVCLIVRSWPWAPVSQAWDIAINCRFRPGKSG